MKIAIAGTGYVGLSNGILLAQHNEVVCLDIVPEKVALLNQKKSPIEDREIEDFLAHKRLNFRATLGKVDAYTGAGTLQRRLQWQGTRDLSAWLALPAAIAFQAQHDWPAVRARCHAKAVAAMHSLRARWGLAPIAADTDLGQMAAIPVPHQDAEALRRRLFDESRIEVPVTQHAGRTFVRISVQGYTTDAEIGALMNAPALLTRAQP